MREKRFSSYFGMDPNYWALAACGAFTASLGLNLIFSGPGRMGPVSAFGYLFVSPLLEEFLFRFIIMGLVYKLTRKAHTAMLVQAALFAAWHLFNPIVIPYAFLMAWLFALLYKKSGKLDSPYLAHCIANLGAVVRSWSHVAKNATTVFAGVVALAMGAGLLIWLFKILKTLPDSGRFTQKDGLE